MKSNSSIKTQDRPSYVVENWSLSFPCDSLYNVSHKIGKLLDKNAFGVDNHVVKYKNHTYRKNGEPANFHGQMVDNEKPRIYLKWTELKRSFQKVKIGDVICKVQKDLSDELQKRCEISKIKYEKIDPTHPTPSNTSTNSPH